LKSLSPSLGKNRDFDEDFRKYSIVDISAGSETPLKNNDAEGNEMAKILFINGINSLSSTHGEEDHMPWPALDINPSPEHGNCECCGRHISELKPFGKAGDPLVDDYDGSYLVKTWRPCGPYDEESIRAMDEAQNHDDPILWLVAEFGTKGMMLFGRALAYRCVGSIWLCRDCIILDDKEFGERCRRCFTAEIIIDQS
jgi:hypothetical protein